MRYYSLIVLVTLVLSCCFYFPIKQYRSRTPAEIREARSTTRRQYLSLLAAGVFGCVFAIVFGYYWLANPDVNMVKGVKNYCYYDFKEDSTYIYQSNAPVKG